MEKEISVAETFRLFLKWVADGAIATQPHPDSYALYGKIVELETKASRVDTLEEKVKEWTVWGEQVKFVVEFANDQKKKKG